jgi:hypothetical protein
VHAGGDSINNDDIQIVLHEREVGDCLGARLGVGPVAGRQGPYEGVGCARRLPDKTIFIKRLKEEMKKYKGRQPGLFGTGGGGGGKAKP